MLGDNSLEDIVLSGGDKEKLPPVSFLNSLRSDCGLCFFSTDDLRQLETKGFFVRDNPFSFSLEKVTQLFNEVQQLYKCGKLKPAGMSQGSTKWQEGKVRGDLNLWLNDREALRKEYPSLWETLEKMQLLQLELNNACNFQSERVQVQLACYPGGGARYVRHLDAFKGGANRRLTIIYYLNVGWKSTDGGALRIFSQEGAEETYDDVEPTADRLVVFQSRTVEHAVLPSFAERFALTMWFY
jgi:SM-20-related protein